jgi:hypothetical protein
LLSLFLLFEVFRLHANKAKKTTFFSLQSEKKKAFFSLIFALSENERRTLIIRDGLSQKTISRYCPFKQIISVCSLPL